MMKNKWARLGVAIAFLYCVHDGNSQTAPTKSATATTTATTEKELAEHRDKAHYYMMRKEPELAIPELQAMEVLAPNDVEVHGNLGVLYYFKNDCVHAIPELRQAMQLQEGLWKQMALLGFCEQQVGDGASAIKDLEAAYPHIEEAKLHRQAGIELIRIYADSNELAKAAGIIEELRKADPTDLELLYTTFQIHKGLTDEAILSISMLDPDSAEMHEIIGQEMLRYGDRLGAIAQLQLAVKRHPKQLGVHFALAEALNSHLEGGNKAAAAEEYKKELLLDHKNEKAECRLGEIAEQSGDVLGAYDHFSRAVELQPGETVGLIGLARSLDLQKKPKEAIALLERAEKQDPADDVVHFRLSVLYRQTGQIEDAKREVAEYQKYRLLKTKLRDIYKKMRLNPTQDEGTDADVHK